MTKEQIKARSQEKVKAISTLCEQLKIVISAEQMITDQGFIKQVVYYTDAENYSVDKEPVTAKKNVDSETVKKTKPVNPAEAKVLEP